MTNFTLNNAYAVEWIDSAGTPEGWIDLSENDYPVEPVKIVSYGIVINKTTEAIVLAQSYSEGGSIIKKQAMGIVTIPITCITDSKEITFSCQESE